MVYPRKANRKSRSCLSRKTLRCRYDHKMAHAGHLFKWQMSPQQECGIELCYLSMSRYINRICLEQVAVVLSMTTDSYRINGDYMDFASYNNNWIYPTTVRVGAGRLQELVKCCMKLGMLAPRLITGPGLAWK